MNTDHARRNATRWFWSLTVLAVALVGALSRELAAPPSPRTGLAVAVTGALAALAALQATRLMVALTRCPVRAKPRPEESPRSIFIKPSSFSSRFLRVGRRR